mmetsp:Transcript_22546/g.61421  ORF Transcript_22546/g.61421 Transcript_22546/m.61421 type:complete len:80 (-) Transcript_22546:255-494(-)
MAHHATRKSARRSDYVEHALHQRCHLVVNHLLRSNSRDPEEWLVPRHIMQIQFTLKQIRSISSKTILMTGSSCCFTNSN